MVEVDALGFRAVQGYGVGEAALVEVVEGGLDDDVDVDGSQFSFNASQKRIRFTKTLWLTQGLHYEMRLSGTYQVVEMSRSKLVIQKEALGVRTVYSFRRYK